MTGEQRLNLDLNSGRFLAGVSRQRWRLIRQAWPHVVLEIARRDGKWVSLRFDCTGYPQEAPTARPWNVALDAPLAAGQWPRGGRVSQVFNPNWQAGAALYIPCDRVSIPGHSAWIAQHPDLIWRPDRGILQYIEAVSELLQSYELITA